LAGIERAFRATPVFNRQLAARYGISEGAIRKRATRGNWVERKRTAGPISPVPCSGQTAQQLAKERVDLVIEVLADVCANGRSGIQRVKAAKIILGLAKGDADPAGSIRRLGKPGGFFDSAASRIELITQSSSAT
jgi:hypothetical protein